MTARVGDDELSPIYRKLYRQVAALPAFEALKDHAHEAVRQAQVVSHRYCKGQYGNTIVCHAKIRIGHQTQDIEFRVEGTEETPYFGLETDHLVEDSDVDEVYFDNVARHGKPIRPHGLVKEETVRSGAEPRLKNRFAPWALSRIFNAESFTKMVARTKQRVHQELIAKLTCDPKFVEFSEGLQMTDIVEKLSPFSHLPPDVLHRAVDLMYVQATMER
jgi:hypothetical protein